MSEKPWKGLVRDWFGDALDDPAAIPGKMKDWFSTDRERDAQLTARYAGLVEAAAQGHYYRWLEHPAGRLALVVALDQLPRNLFRGTSRAFAYDPYTAALCLAAVHTGEDRKLLPVQRAFLYMPLQHFEDLQAQQTSVELYEKLGAENPQTKIFTEGFTPYAREHRDIIARFGRFPHRNAVLGRKSTPEEAEYLAGDAPRFGQ